MAVQCAQPFLCPAFELFQRGAMQTRARFCRQRAEGLAKQTFQHGGFVFGLALLPAMLFALFSPFDDSFGQHGFNLQ
ncbi:MAG: hypothetical protein AW08_00896 [Candidatus Accumulibacter adjunctus]|uniref:Uncharacterized protein n=1 Tax=Candidatus Accumulibacter adjunctus TaxID=1454001 RepID=A0A011PQI4_9PROT|nr:MAG: hypothetical protein AW08_00896 [Candidatus Accumulibacter adjunctus]